ncbi:Uma2 family endonuclease [Amycolatopsis sp. NPDC051373]|uniref:Uma2 family endonuclease n=1 Tax=Amycolatopsis sp. NPDC051373 TaxID=3155801 RepID=UPI0034504022
MPPAGVPRRAISANEYADLPRELVTLEYWEALPETSEWHIEVVEGALLTTPPPPFWRQRVAYRAAHLIDEQFGGHGAFARGEMLLEHRPLTVRVPDVVVVPWEILETNPQRVQAEDVLLVVEVLSEGTKRTDQITKHSEYAAAGMRQYWIIDVEAPVSMITYRLLDGRYETAGEYSGKVKLGVSGHPIVLDLDKLIAPRPSRL